MHERSRSIEKAIAHLVAHLDRLPSPEALAAHAGYSPFHFARLFRAVTGESIGAMGRRLRLERAALSLREGGRPVGEVALDAGYATSDAFARAFRTAYGLSPRAFRRSEYPRTTLPAPGGVHIVLGYSASRFMPLPQTETMTLEILDLAPRRMAAIRHIGPYNEIGPAFERLGAWAAPLGIFAEPNARMFSVQYNDPRETPPDELRSDVGIFVGNDRIGEGDIEIREAPAGRYVRATYLGPYEGLPDAWERFVAAADARGFALREGPTFEVYVGDPRTDPPESLRTDLHLPVE